MRGPLGYGHSERPLKIFLHLQIFRETLLGKEKEGCKIMINGQGWDECQWDAKSCGKKQGTRAKARPMPWIPQTRGRAQARGSGPQRQEDGPRQGKMKANANVSTWIQTQ